MSCIPCSNFTRSALAAVLLTGTLVACGDDDDVVAPGDPTIAQVAIARPELSTLSEALESSGGLLITLGGSGPYTLFAATDDAFNQLPEGLLDELFETPNLAVLQDLLRYHVVLGTFAAGDLTDGQQLPTLSGEMLTVSVQNGVVRVDGAQVTTADIDASNGVIHIVDGALTGSLSLLELVGLAQQLSSVEEAVQNAGLVAALAGEDLTFFAPNNNALAVAGGAVPTDSAQLAQLLQLHVVDTARLSSELTDNQQLMSLLGTPLAVDVNGSTISITGPNNTVTLVVRDLRANNGVLHVIDGVLRP